MFSIFFSFPITHASSYISTLLVYTFSGSLGLIHFSPLLHVKSSMGCLSPWSLVLSIGFTSKTVMSHPDLMRSTPGMIRAQFLAAVAHDTCKNTEKSAPNITTLMHLCVMFTVSTSVVVAALAGSPRYLYTQSPGFIQSSMFSLKKYIATWFIHSTNLAIEENNRFFLSSTRYRLR